MKKLLGISVIAALAVLPMAGYAAVTDADPGATVTENAQMATNSPKYGLAQAHSTDGNLATAGYVKGAYNAAIKAVNKLSDDTDEAIDAINDIIGNTQGLTGTLVEEIAAAKNAAKEESTAFDNTNAELGEGVDTVQEAIDALDTRLDTAEDDIDTLEGKFTGSASTSGTVANFVKTGAAGADYDHDNSGLSATTIQGAIDEVEGRVDSAEAKLTGSASTSGTVANQVKTGAAGADYDHDNSGLSATTIQGAIDEVEGRVDTLETSVNTTLGNTYAKKTGVTQTITNSTISGTVPVMATWDNTTATTVPIQASITGATYAEPTTPAAGD